MILGLILLLVLLAAGFGFLFLCALAIRMLFVIAPVVLMPTKEMVRRSHAHEASTRSTPLDPSFTDDDEYGARYYDF